MMKVIDTGSSTPHVPSAQRLSSPKSARCGQYRESKVLTEGKGKTTAEVSKVICLF